MAGAAVTRARKAPVTKRAPRKHEGEQEEWTEKDKKFWCAPNTACFLLLLPWFTSYARPRRRELMEDEKFISRPAAKEVRSICEPATSSFARPACPRPDHMASHPQMLPNLDPDDVLGVDTNRKCAPLVHLSRIASSNNTTRRRQMTVRFS